MTDQSINQSNDWSINQSIEWLINQSINRMTDQSINQSNDWSINQSIEWLINQSIKWITNQSINQSISRTNDRLNIEKKRTNVTNCPALRRKISKIQIPAIWFHYYYSHKSMSGEPPRRRTATSAPWTSFCTGNLRRTSCSTCKGNQPRK